MAGGKTFFSQFDLSNDTYAFHESITKYGLFMIGLEQVDNVEGDDVDCKIKNSATLAGALFTLHASQIHIDLPTLTDKDKEVSLLV